jgi:tRNA(Arg) A34 adenosine deaminase TadA
MCLGAIYWARPSKVYYACTRADAAHVGFDDDMIYREIPMPIEQRHISMTQLLRQEALEVFDRWQQKTDKTAY